MPSFGALNRENESLECVKLNLKNRQLQMVPPTSIYNSLGIHGIFWSHLEQGIGHGSIVPSFGALNRENESLDDSKKLNFDKPSAPDGSSYVGIQLTRQLRNFLESFRRGYWPRIDCA